MRQRPARGCKGRVVRQKSSDAYRRDILAKAVTRVSHISDHVECDIRSTDVLSIERNDLFAMRAHAALMSHQGTPAGLAPTLPVVRSDDEVRQLPES